MEFYHHRMDVNTLPTHIYVQTTCKVNFASDDPFKGAVHISRLKRVENARLLFSKALGAQEASVLAKQTISCALRIVSSYLSQNNEGLTSHKVQEIPGPQWWAALHFSAEVFKVTEKVRSCLVGSCHMTCGALAAFWKFESFYLDAERTRLEKNERVAPRPRRFHYERAYRASTFEITNLSAQKTPYVNGP